MPQRCERCALPIELVPLSFSYLQQFVELQSNLLFLLIGFKFVVSFVDKLIDDSDTFSAFDFLIDNNSKCKFTVIGSPMINSEQKNNNSNNNNNIVWEFDNETDLIK